MSNFVDEAAICVRGGDGGAGAVSFRKEAFVPRGGPDGGDGGKGGDVWLVADRNVASLIAFKDHPHRRAGNGVHGRGQRKNGAHGNDAEVKVPVGTVVKDPEGVVVADLVNPGDRWLASAGGHGGRGNASFLSNKRRAPGFAEQGEYVAEQWLRMELKLLADVALVGFPNVGKSTLISRISAAKPKIADYPFTTLEPNLGVVRLDDGFEMVVADIPGLIEGAAEGRGLGHRFLRHVERARVLVVLLDLAPADGTSPDHQEKVLLSELGSYQPELLERRRVVVGSRADLVPDLQERAALFGGRCVSAVTGEGIPQLLGDMAAAVRAARDTEPVPDAFVVHRPATEGFRIERRDDASYEIVGRQAARAVNFSDLTNPEALDEAHRRLKKLGITNALARAGAHTGDVVRIGALEFTYEADDVALGGEGRR